jgi:hypothetical protein
VIYMNEYPKKLSLFNNDLVILAKNILSKEKIKYDFNISTDKYIISNMLYLITLKKLKHNQLKSFCKKYNVICNISNNYKSIKDICPNMTYDDIIKTQIKNDWNIYNMARAEFYNTFNKELVLYKICGGDKHV